MTAPHHSLPAPRPDWALFLDIDGTLIDIAPTPASVVVPPGLGPLLRTLSGRLAGALALVSGRRLSDLDTLFAPLTIAAAGQHGAEIRDADGTVCRFEGTARILAGLLPEIMSFAQARPGILVEDKGLTIAIHCRQVPQYQQDLGRFIDGLVGQDDPAIETIRGHRVFEIKPRNLSKRTAVEQFMRQAPFVGRHPIFIGDDRTDEDGFAAVQSLGGCAIRVGPEAPSRATYRLSDPAQTRAYLSDAVEVLSADIR